MYARNCRNIQMRSTDRQLRFAAAESEMVQNENPDRRRQIAPVGSVIDGRDERGYGHVLEVGDLAQAVPELVLQRHTRLVSIADNRAFDHG